MGQPILVLVLYMDGITLLKHHFWASGLNMLLNYRMATPNTSGQPGWVIFTRVIPKGAETDSQHRNSASRLSRIAQAKNGTTTTPHRKPHTYE